MMSLFSIFNPTTSLNQSLSWMIILLPILMLGSKFWVTKSPSMNTIHTPMIMLKTQFKASSKETLSPSILITLSLFTTIYLMNTMSLLPMVFAPTSQIMINMSLALPMWMASMMYKMNQPINMLAHMTPMSTPTALIPLMVMIELVSLMIQPITLAIRLTANITAGHILMSLITTPYSEFPIPLSLINMVLHMTFTMLEIGVSIIQAYVFSLLITMYLNN